MPDQYGYVRNGHFYRTDEQTYHDILRVSRTDAEGAELLHQRGLVAGRISPDPEKDHTHYRTASHDPTERRTREHEQQP
jgi:hypothetical protein